MKVFFFLLSRFIIRDLLKNRVRSILTVLGIALGVAVMLAINLANKSALAKFQESIDLISGKTTLVVRANTDADFDEALLEKLSFLWDRDIKFTPLIEQLAVTAQEPHEVIQVLGIDTFADSKFRELKLEEKDEGDATKDSGAKAEERDNGGASKDSGAKAESQSDDNNKNGEKRNEDAGENAGESFGILKLNHAYVGSRLAEQYGLKPGDKFNVLANDRQKELIVEGILSAEGLGRAFSGNLLLMDIGCAQNFFAMNGRISRIELIVDEKNSEIDSIQNELAKVLPENLVSERPQRRGQQVEKMLRSFQYNLTALSLIALLVGIFLIYNTMSISVIRRRWEIGTLTALGLSAKTLFALFAAEAGILGICGSGLGVGAGLFFASYALKAVSRTVQALYADQPVSSIILEPQTLWIAFFAGIILTLAAAIAPAIEAISIAPAEATRRASYERKIESLAPKLAAFGCLLLLLAGIASQQEALAGFPFFGYLAAALAVFGAAALTPFILDIILKQAAKFISKPLGMEARLAALSLHGALGRTSVTVASLMVGISMMVSLAVMIGSFRQTVMSWVDQTLRSDLWLEPASRITSNRAGSLSPEIVKTIRSLEGIAAVDAFGEVPIEYEGEPCNLGNGELEVMKDYGNLIFLNGRSCKKVLSDVEAHNSVIVSESFALKHKKKEGDFVKLASPLGPVEVKVEAIYYDYASDSGYIVFPRPLFEKHFGIRPPTTLSIFLKKDADPEKIRRQIFASLPDTVRLNIRTNKELKNEVLRIFDNTFAITYSLHAISIAVAILGVMNALFAMTMEARRDLGILKYLGGSKEQLVRMVLVQAGLLGTLGNAGGLAVGFMLSFLLIHVINKQSFGWTIQLAVPVEFLLQSFALIFACSLLSGFLPARLAARTPAPEVMRSE